MTDTDNSTNINNLTNPQEVEDLDFPLASINSVALARLIEEVRNTGECGASSTIAYNRTYHRHNR